MGPEVAGRDGVAGGGSVRGVHLVLVLRAPGLMIFGVSGLGRSFDHVFTRQLENTRRYTLLLPLAGHIPPVALLFPARVKEL